MDYALAEAVYILDKEVCGSCHVPAWHAYSTDSEIAFKMEEHTCHACAFKEQEEELDSKKEGVKKFGVTKYVSVVHDSWEYESEGEKSKLPGRLEWRQAK